MKHEQVTDILTVGQRLHLAETAIGVGRRALHELLRQEPVDEIAVNATRQAILDARLQRNSLRNELEVTRPIQVYSGYSWLTYSNDK